MAFFRRGPAGMRSVSDEYDSGALKILYNISMFFYLYILQSQKDAEAREKYLKTSMGKRVLKKQLKNFINSLKSDKITFNL